MTAVAALLLTANAASFAHHPALSSVFWHDSIVQSAHQTQVRQLVAVVGCLTVEPEQMWVLTHGSAPVVTKTPYSTEADMSDAKTRPLGKRRYRLLGVLTFNPDAHKAERVVIKGILIERANDARINVTSLQPAHAACGRD